MARETDFGHDQVAHLLADHLIEVPRFQRRYSWSPDNVTEFLEDLRQARTKDEDYFIGTVVFTLPEEGSVRRRVVDGQQRIATTSILLMAIRDRLQDLGKEAQAKKLEERYLQGYELEAEGDVERLMLGPKDAEAYGAFLTQTGREAFLDHPLASAFATCQEHLARVAPLPEDYRKLMAIVTQLEKRVQVLVAVATNVQEAYVIFETLNDRGADLTTADLLKNYLFSRAGSYQQLVEYKWIAIESSFEKPDELLKLIRYELVSRKGPVATRKLYKAIQDSMRDSGDTAKVYLERLVRAKEIYIALRDPDNPFWDDTQKDVRDSLLAYRRFGFESSIPALISVFLEWEKDDACALLNKILKWTVRALFVGNIGAKLSEEVFGEVAEAIANGDAKNQVDVRAIMDRLIPSDAQFKIAFSNFGEVSTARAKYLLAMLEKAEAARKGTESAFVDWSTTAVNIEHIYPKSRGSELAGAEKARALVGTIGNLTLLEKRLNKDLGGRPAREKAAVYAQSSFLLTQSVQVKDGWASDQIVERAKRLGELACLAWPEV